MKFLLCETALETQRFFPGLFGPDEGGVVQFFGVARRSSHHSSKEVIRLEYEAYGPMAETEMESIFAEMRGRFGVEKAIVLHRIGKVELGEAAVAIGVAAEHRAEAFDACRFLIDELKSRVPIWKKEVYADGSEWVGCRP